MRILFVEDDPEQAEFWLLSLTGHGFDVTLAVHGVDAIVAATDPALAPFDVVLMDISLGPGMSGIEAAARLRVVHPHLPVIFMSAHGDGETLEEAKLAMPAGYLIKPFEYRDLLQAIERGTSTMPDVSIYNDHDLLVRLDVKLDLVSVQLNEARALVAAKADAEAVEKRLSVTETALVNVQRNQAMAFGGLVLLQVVGIPVMLWLLGKLSVH